MTKRILILAILALSACGDDDGTVMVDSGPTPDTGPTPDEIDRYLTLERLDTMQFCECAVSAGDFADVDSCFDADPAAISTEAEVTCIRGEFANASEADRAIFECQMDAGEGQLDCRGALSCDDYSASPPSAERIACDDSSSEIFDDCGTASNDQAFNDCFD